MGWERSWRCSRRSSSGRASSFCSTSKSRLQYSQPFRSQCILLGGTLRHGFDPFSSSMGPAACPGGSAQDIVAAVAVRDHNAAVTSEYLLSAGPLAALLIAEAPAHSAATGTASPPGACTAARSSRFHIGAKIAQSARALGAPCKGRRPSATPEFWRDHIRRRRC